LEQLKQQYGLQYELGVGKESVVFFKVDSRNMKTFQTLQLATLPHIFAVPIPSEEENSKKGQSHIYGRMKLQDTAWTEGELKAEVERRFKVSIPTVTNSAVSLVVGALLSSLFALLTSSLAPNFPNSLLTHFRSK